MINLPLAPYRVLRWVRKALSFNGAGDYVVVPDSPMLRVTDNFTIEMLVRSDRDLLVGTPPGYYGGMWKGYDYGLGWYGHIDGWGLYICDGTTTEWCSAPNTPISRGEWQHVAAVNNNRNAKVYVNVVEKGSATFTISPRQREVPIEVGVFRRGYWDGIIAVVRIYDCALSKRELEHNCYNLNDPILDGLIMWLHWDSIDISAGIWYDKSGYGNHGTIYGATLVELVKTPVRKLVPARKLAVVR